MNDPVSIDAIRIRQLIRNAEATADAALLAQSELMGAMLRFRLSNDVEVHTGQSAIIRLARAQQSFVDGASDLFRTHDELMKVKRELCIGDEAGSTKPTGLLADEAQAA